MKILYLSSVPTKKEFIRVKSFLRENVQITNYGMLESGFKFHTLIQEGIVANTKDEVYSLVGRSVNHKNYKGLWWKSRKEKISENYTAKHVGFINLPVIKQLITGIAFFTNTLGWLLKNRKQKDKYIVLDASYITVIPFVMLACRFIKCKKTAIFCDIYSYMGNVLDARNEQNFIYKAASMIMQHYYKKLDGFILLTEAMSSVVNQRQKPFLVMEGLVDINMKNTINVQPEKNKRVIMYAGALRKQYGLENLVKGFMQYRDERAELHIYGDGDYISEIKKFTNIDKRIVYGGSISNEEIVRKELEATILVNPRPFDQEFTKFSFPSKNMEYMVSGTPVLTTRLPGMPTEYYPYIYTIDGNSPEDVVVAFENVFSFTDAQRQERGHLAKKFVIENKNNNMQANRIKAFLERC